MKQLNVDLENCYGIKRLKMRFDFFGGRRLCHLRAKRTMKSSFANTLLDVANGAGLRQLSWPVGVNYLGR
jgi:hypothetical protein